MCLNYYAAKASFLLSSHECYEKAIYQNSTLNNSLIIAGGAHYRNLSFNFDTYGDVKYVRFIPKIDISGVTTPCSGSSLQKDAAEIRNCSSS